MFGCFFFSKGFGIRERVSATLRKSNEHRVYPNTINGQHDGTHKFRQRTVFFFLEKGKRFSIKIKDRINEGHSILEKHRQMGGRKCKKSKVSCGFLIIYSWPIFSLWNQLTLALNRPINISRIVYVVVVVALYPFVQIKETNFGHLNPSAFSVVQDESTVNSFCRLLETVPVISCNVGSLMAGYLQRNWNASRNDT